MAIGAGPSCVKYLLFCFNLLFAITGLIVIIVGVQAQIKAHPYFYITDQTFITLVPLTLIVIGVVIFVVAFFGWCGAVKENHCMITTFSALLLIIFVAELAIGIAGYMNHSGLETSIERDLNNSMKLYPTDSFVKNTFNAMQVDLECCGIKSPNDWATHGLPIPDTCCSEDGAVSTSGCSAADPNFHKDGCLNNLVTFLNKYSVWLGGVGLGIAIVQLLGVIFACCLARSIRSQYETV